jgi:peptide/nickel transport system permease protein
VTAKATDSPGLATRTAPRGIEPGRRRQQAIRLLRRPACLLGLAILLFWVAMAFGWPAVAPYSPTEFHLIAKFAPPSAGHWLGTDNFGRDVLSRILAGSRSVLIVATNATLLGVLFGTLLGLIAAYYRGWIEELLMRALDVFMAFPMIVVALLVIAVLGPSKLNVVLVVALAFAPYNARVVRSAALAQRDKDFVAAARLRGESGAYIMLAEILPNIGGTIVVELTVRLALAIFTVATLSFLGLGIQPPTPDWGLMIAEGRQFYRIAPWIVAFPSAAIASLVIGINLVAEGLAR